MAGRNDAGDITVFPNPAHGSVQISMKNTGNTYTGYQILDMSGKVVAQAAFDGARAFLDRATAGDDPLDALSGHDQVHVLGTSDAPDSVAAGRALVARARGRYVSATGFSELQVGLLSILN